VPEPGNLILFGSGLAVAVGFLAAAGGDA